MYIYTDIIASNLASQRRKNLKKAQNNASWDLLQNAMA